MFQPSTKLQVNHLSSLILRTDKQRNRHMADRVKTSPPWRSHNFPYFSIRIVFFFTVLTKSLFCLNLTAQWIRRHAHRTIVKCTGFNPEHEWFMSWRQTVISSGLERNLTWQRLVWPLTWNMWILVPCLQFFATKRASRGRDACTSHLLTSASPLSSSLPGSLSPVYQNNDSLLPRAWHHERKIKSVKWTHFHLLKKNKSKDSECDLIYLLHCLCLPPWVLRTNRE